MVLKIWKYPTIGAFVLIALTPGATRAAPLAFSVSDFDSSAKATAGLERVASRQCWWRNGRQRCRSVAGAVPGHYHRNDNEGNYYVHDSSRLPFGSKRWWEQKESEGSLGRP
jgi:hypothetical protein